MKKKEDEEEEAEDQLSFGIITVLMGGSVVLVIGKFEIVMERMFEFSSFSASCLKGKGGIGMMEEGEIDGGDSVSSSASEVSVGVGSCESDSMEEFTSSASSSPPSQDQLAPPATALHDMSSLFQHLPFKRGLSKYYQGKSESFTSLSNVRCLEDLAKPENPYNKKLKTSRSYGGGLSEKIDDTHKSSPPKRLHPRLISKKASRGRCSQMNLNAKSRVNFLLGS